jgi:hypothetical protein
VARDAEGRQPGQLAAPETPTSATKVQASIADRGDGGDPRAVGDLLGTWLGVKLDQVDALVDDARSKVAAIPQWRVIAQLVGELVISQHALEAEVGQLRAEVARLRQRGRAA